ncbi:CheB methylesterase domain-containing protein [uncultured Pelagimonas sp.]|uniref:CheB methylesterase domain-containing protein n=1 Tax=uncultured Pelagimonas sp. TaxID=1618102 RepID=UPI002636C2B8|nr:CheB methylesterase domain-containing protein [uncultured Pelagimonas sp.]
MTNKTVIVATSNATQRNQISELVERILGFQVIGCTGDLMNTYNLVESRVPNAVLISDSLANLEEFEVMRALFSTLDVRWLVLTAPNKAHRSTSSTNVGSDLFSVPGNATATVIEGQLRSLTRSGPCRHPPAKQSASAKERTDARLAMQRSKMPACAPKTHKHKVASPKSSRASQSEPIILIGASTGGVDALLKVLSCFPSNCPPTMIVQHTGLGFGASLAGLLNRQCAPSVKLAQEPTPLKRGNVIIGAGNKAHLVLETGSILSATLQHGDQVTGHLPSVDMLFESSVQLAPRISAAILTGMGRDGAKGLLKLRQAGAVTFAQDEASSVVYGMPRAAVEIGAAQSTLPIDQIGPALLKGPKWHSVQHRKVLS